MKFINVLSVLALFFSVALFQSCDLVDPCSDVTCLNDGICLDGTCDCTTGFSGTDCSTHCSEQILGTWKITNGTIFCDFLEYQFTRGSGNSGLNIVMVGVDGTWSGSGTLSADCKTMSYNATLNGASLSRDGNFTFNGNNLTENHGTSCTYEATKQ